MSKTKCNTTSLNIKLNETKTKEFIVEVESIINSKNDDYTKAKELANKVIGIHVINDNLVKFAFWVPGLKEGLLKDKENQFKLELFTPEENVIYAELKKGDTKEVVFNRNLIQLLPIDDYLVGVVEDVKIGTKENAGTLYWLKYTNDNNNEFIMRDPLVQSCPLGIYAPYEIYNIPEMLKNRNDIDYFNNVYKKKCTDGFLRAYDIGICLEIHTETATEEGTLRSLTDKYKLIADKLQKNIDDKKEDIYYNLTPDEFNFIGFDSIELTPEVPPVERESCEAATGEFFRILSKKNDKLTVEIKKPDISDWGYDTPIIGTAAVNPSILATGRPDEFLEFIETLHNMPDRPIQLAFDAVLGHADFQGARLLRTFDDVSKYPENLLYMNSKYFRGPNMYGRDINYAEPLVRAILLEMYKRKIDFGFDCVRVDGGQDFVKEIDEETQFRIQDDVFINEMVNTTQDINGIKRYLDMNVEDGRPWPNDLNWLYNATYSEHVLERTLPHGDKVKQWGPLIFAHNVHGKFKWFQVKWDRFKDTFKEGGNWITGLSNHDNARYYYRLVNTKPSSSFKEGDSFDDFYNDQLGETNPEVVHNALDNGALSAVSLAILPGSPMFFLNALFHTPWLFFRDIDKKYGVKVVADEGSRFLTWYINEELYKNPDNFVRLKKLGFKSLKQLISDPKKKKKPAFMDHLFVKHEEIKTDPVMVLYLYDDPNEIGAFADVQKLSTYLEMLLKPKIDKEKEYSKFLKSRINSDTIESERKVTCARRTIKKSLVQLNKDIKVASKKACKKLKKQIQKLEFLNELVEADNNTALAMLMEDAAYHKEYNIEDWAKDELLNDLAPSKMKKNGRLTKQKLMDFALAFMKDCKDISNAGRYFESVDEQKVKYNFDLRNFRKNNSWLLENPTNDIALDFFSRKIIANGAKDLGAFFSDKGDTINSNTIYYGWRTSPCKSEQVFVMANMEGKPLSYLPLNQFMPFDGEWEVVIKSPGIKDLPAKVDKNFILTNFKNGEAFVLTRKLK